MDWANMSSAPKPKEAGYSQPFLVEFERTVDGRRITAVCRSYMALLDEFHGLQSLQKGFTFDSAQPGQIYEPLQWHPMPETCPSPAKEQD